MVQMAIRKWMNFTFGHEKQIRTQEKEKSGSVLMCEHNRCYEVLYFI